LYTEYIKLNQAEHNHKTRCPTKYVMNQLVFIVVFFFFNIKICYSYFFAILHEILIGSEIVKPLSPYSYVVTLNWYICK